MNNVYTGKFVKYYDDLFHKKDYVNESNFIENNSNLNKLLDVGCGTGTHLENLYKDGRIFYGIDTSDDMINIANNKSCFKDTRCNLKVSSVENFDDENNFDTVISMFNIVNHITSLEELNNYFKSISSLLSDNGTFIFDCFNGTAVYKDAPKDIQKGISSYATGGYYSVSYKSDFNSMTSKLIMDTNVKVYHLEDQVDEFDYTLEHIMWLPNILSGICESNNLKVNKIVSNSDYESNATDEDYKITFVCKKVV